MTKGPKCCARVGKEVTDCWYDQMPCETMLVILSNIRKISLSIYLIPVIGARRRLLPLTAVCRCRPYIAVGRISLSAVSGIADVRYHNTKLSPLHE